MHFCKKSQMASGFAKHKKINFLSCYVSTSFVTSLEIEKYQKMVFSDRKPKKKVFSNGTLTWTAFFILAIILGFLVLLASDLLLGLNASRSADFLVGLAVSSLPTVLLPLRRRSTLLLRLLLRLVEPERVPEAFLPLLEVDELEIDSCWWGNGVDFPELGALPDVPLRMFFECDPQVPTKISTLKSPSQKVSIFNFQQNFYNFLFCTCSWSVSLVQRGVSCRVCIFSNNSWKWLRTKFLKSKIQIRKKNCNFFYFSLCFFSRGFLPRLCTPLEKEQTCPQNSFCSRKTFWKKKKKKCIKVSKWLCKVVLLRGLLG